MEIGNQMWSNVHHNLETKIYVRQYHNIPISPNKKRKIIAICWVEVASRTILRIDKPWK
jgi:hypothetical protein